MLKNLFEIIDRSVGNGDTLLDELSPDHSPSSLCFIVEVNVNIDLGLVTACYVSKTV